MACYIANGKKEDCCGCGACMQCCPKQCISMKPDSEGFLYPVVDDELCVKCGKCTKVCPLSEDNEKYIHDHEFAQCYGGYMRDKEIRANSTSGGAFTFAVNAFCDEDCVIFGAEMDDKFNVFHSFVDDKSKIGKLRTSKYLQSNIGESYANAQNYLDAGKKVLFSGTPCQIAGLYSFLGGDRENLFTVDLVCHGVPSNKWFYKEINYLEKKYKSQITAVQFRNKDNGHWDNGSMVWIFENGKRKKNISEPFMGGWLSGLISRPVCYECKFASLNRVGDMTVADLWGVHHFAPGLYGENKGASLLMLNTEKAKKYFEESKHLLKTEKININDAAKHNDNLKAPMKKSPKRDEFMSKIESMSFKEMVNTYLPKPNYVFILTNKFINRKVKTFLGSIYKKLRARR